MINKSKCAYNTEKRTKTHRNKSIKPFLRKGQARDSSFVLFG